MGLKNKITILSTFASDKIVDEQGYVYKVQEGGPGFYFKKVFAKEKINFRLLTGQKLRVEILITTKGEFGKIKERPLIKNVIFKKIRTPFLLISSILNEFNLEQLPAFQGLVFLDIQGYVRSRGSFGQKKNWQPNKAIFANIFCLKVTQEELKYLSSKYIKEQKQKILLVTKGRFGCDVFYFGKKFTIKPEKIIKIDNAVGAGDTFFAYFISKYMKTNNVIASVKYATAMVLIFLEKNASHHHEQLL
jgi:hypothetical protein